MPAGVLQAAGQQEWAAPVRHSKLVARSSQANNSRLKLTHCKHCCHPHTDLLLQMLLPASAGSEVVAAAAAATAVVLPGAAAAAAAVPLQTTGSPAQLARQAAEQTFFMKKL